MADATSSGSSSDQPQVIRSDVNSSLIRGVGHSGNVMEVEFTNGTVYRYHGVTREVATALIESPSPGRYFNANIKDGYTAERVG